MATNNQSQRVNFSSIQKQMPYRDFLEIQLKSFHDFFQIESTPEERRQEGLYKVFMENFPLLTPVTASILNFWTIMSIIPVTPLKSVSSVV